MPDEIIAENIRLISESIDLVIKRFSKINQPDDLVSNDGVLILDAIAMRLRDIVSHHYEKIDHEIIFDICQNHLPQLQKAIQSMMK